MRSRWRTVLDRPGRYRLLALLESAAYTWIHRRPVWITRNGPYWTIRTWRGVTTVSAGYRWRGPDFWRDLTADLLFFQYRPRAGDVVVDIGAGMGEELPSLCQSVAPGGRVIAVEAHPFTYEGLVRAISLNRLANGVPVAAALSDQTGTTMISDVDDPDLNSTLPGALLTRAQVRVPAVTLDDLAQRMAIERIDLLTMNIEGAERLAIRGMDRALRQTRNVVISCHDFLAAESGDESLRTKDLIVDTLRSAGFNVLTRHDEREFVADYVYGTRDAPTGP
jgi:FkbM family methyltransferase